MNDHYYYGLDYGNDTSMKLEEEYLAKLRVLIDRQILMGQSSSAPTNRKQRRAAARKKP